MSPSRTKLAAPTVLVTGASTGIGRACVAELCAAGNRVLAGVRTQTDADALTEAFGPAVVPVILDVTDEVGRARAFDAIATLCAETGLDGLVNNAGIVVAGPLAELPVVALERQFAVNLFGLHAVTAAMIPHLAKAKPRPGRIVMIGSVSGTSASPFLGPYAASKHALEGYSRSLRSELMVYGIAVTVLAPGPVRTPIWDKTAQNDAANLTPGSVYARAVSRFMRFAERAGKTGLPAEAVAKAAAAALRVPNPPQRRVLIRNRLVSHDLPKLLPKALVDGAVARALGLRPGRGTQ